MAAVELRSAALVASPLRWRIILLLLFVGGASWVSSSSSAGDSGESGGREAEMAAEGFVCGLRRSCSLGGGCGSCLFRLPAIAVARWPLLLLLFSSGEVAASFAPPQLLCSASSPAGGRGDGSPPRRRPPWRLRVRGAGSRGSCGRG